MNIKHKVIIKRSLIKDKVISKVFSIGNSDFDTDLLNFILTQIDEAVLNNELVLNNTDVTNDMVNVIPITIEVYSQKENTDENK